MPSPRFKRSYPKATSTRKYDSWNARFLDTWVLEIFAVIFSLSCFIGICGILIAYDGKTRPELQYGLSLNAIISLLATGCKSSLLFAIGEALSQTKWAWFRTKTRPLLDIQAFDSASRGPFGSIMMVFQARGCLATFGASIVVLLLAFDPFVQQITKYPTRSAPITVGNGVATTKILNSFIAKDATAAQWDMAYLSGLWSDDNLYRPRCSSGNCTWPVSRSVGVCSKCADITNTVAFECQKNSHDHDSQLNQFQSENQAYFFNASCHITPQLGDPTAFNSTFFIPFTNNTRTALGRTVDFQQSLSWLVHAEFGYDRYVLLDQNLSNLTFQGIMNPMMVLAHAEMEYDLAVLNSSHPVKGLSLKKVTECSLSLCQSDWDISVHNGVTRFEASNLDYGKFDWMELLNPDDNTPDRSLCWMPSNFDLENSSHGIVPFNGTRSAPSNLSDHLGFCFIDFTIPILYKSFVGSSWRHIQWFNGELTSMNLSAYKETPAIQRITSIGLEHVMSNLANSMNKLVLESNGEDLHGIANGTEVYVAVQWPWLILPGLLVVFGASFFLFALLSNKNKELWKSSTLALIYHGLHDVDSTNSVMTSGMEKEAADTNVQLRDSGGRGNLKLETDSTQ